MEVNVVKALVKIIFLGAMFFVSQLAISGTTISNEAIINLATSADVRDQLSKLPPADRKKLEATMIIGNKFIQAHFDHAAYEADPDNYFWLHDVAPLVSMGAIEWKNQDWTPVIKKIKQGDKTLGGTRLTCPQVTLVSVLRSNGEVTLSYRATIMAMLINDNWWENWIEVLPDQGNYDVSIKLNRDNRVFEVDAQDNVITTVYTDSYIRFKRALFGTTPTADSEHMKEQYKKLSGHIEQQAKQICK